MSVSQYMQQLGAQARTASRAMAKASTEQKNAALAALADRLLANEAALIEANAKDLAAGQENNLDAAMMDRLAITSAGVQAMAEGVRQVAALADPVGQISDGKYLPSGIHLSKMRVPLGVVGIIYESRPNVTVDAAILCLKSGNATILRGGKEALHSNQAIAEIVRASLFEVGLPMDAVQVVNTTDRAAVTALIQDAEHVDVIVPRGGKGLIERISTEARVPVIKHLDGNCHTYIAQDADLEMAVNLVLNAKTRRYGVCNALESLLVHESVAGQVLQKSLRPLRLLKSRCVAATGPVTSFLRP